MDLKNKFSTSTSVTEPIQPFTYIVRFDIAPLWVADGFVMNDEVALDMLANHLPYACQEWELAAKVLCAPSPARIEDTQGFKPGSISKVIMQGAPEAYKDFGENTVTSAIIDAIQLIDSVAYVREKGDNSRDVLAKLLIALGKMTGSTPISDIEWMEAE